MAGISDDVENLRVNRADFLHALDEVHPAFGVSEEELQQVIQNGIIQYDGTVDVSDLVHMDGVLSHLSTGTSPHRPALRGTSPHVYTHTARQHSSSRSLGLRKNRSWCYHCITIPVPLHQTNFPWQHGRFQREPKSGSHQQSVHW